MNKIKFFKKYVKSLSLDTYCFEVLDLNDHLNNNELNYC